MSEEELELQFVDVLSQLESVLSQQSALHSALQRGAQLLTRERTHARRRVDLALVDATKIAPTRRLVRRDGVFELEPCADDHDDDDDDDGEVKSTALVALGGALPSQVLRDAQRAFDECATRAVRLANERARLSAAVAKFAKLKQQQQCQ